jgi:hypothetical protein
MGPAALLAIDAVAVAAGVCGNVATAMPATLSIDDPCRFVR